MSFLFPAWVIDKVGVISEDEQGRRSVSDEADTSEVKYGEILTSLSGQPPDRIEMIEIAEVSAWRYAAVSVGGTLICELVEIPDQWGASRPPSAAENAIGLAWCVDAAYDPDGICLRYPNNAMLCWRGPMSQPITVDAVIAATGLAKKKLAATFERTLRERTKMEIAAASPLLDPVGASVYAKLFQNALCESQVQLRFLYFYRVFERSYMSSAYAQLSSDFFLDPRAALATAEKAVSNERLSFISLVRPSRVSSWFELLEQEAASLSNSNQFMAAIFRSCDKDGWLKDKEAWRRGCSISYKIRCAIVHSGERGPIFEEFRDAEVACAALVPYLESAAAALLEIQPREQA